MHKSIDEWNDPSDACHDVIVAPLEHKPLMATFNVPLTFVGFAYGNVVCRLSPDALRPDVHCPVVFNIEVVPDDRALLVA